MPIIKETAFRRVYLFAGVSAHILPTGLQVSLCGAAPPSWGRWYGYDRIEELDKVNSMQLCTACNVANISYDLETKKTTLD